MESHATIASNVDTSTNAAGTTTSATLGFPYILANILEAESPDIIMWSGSGRSFGIRNMSVFKTKILPQYFKHDKFSSFQRQLNLYGFRKIVKGRESGCYIHCYFQHKRPDLLSQVRRGQVPPCPSRYVRKVYGCSSRAPQSGTLPADVENIDSSDSEPELRRPLNSHSSSASHHRHNSDSSQWEGSFQDQKVRREFSNRRVTKLFPTRSEETNFSFPSSQISGCSISKPTDISPVQVHSTVPTAIPDSTFFPQLDNPIRDSFSAMLDMLANDFSTEEYDISGDVHGNYGDSLSGEQDSGLFNHPNADQLNFSLSLFDRPILGSQLIDMAYDLQASRLNLEPLNPYIPEQMKSMQLPIERPSQIVDSSYHLNDTARNGDSSYYCGHRRSLTELVRFIDPNQPTVTTEGSMKRPRVPDITVEKDKKFEDSNGPRTTLRNSILCALDVLNQGSNQGCALPMAPGITGLADTSIQWPAGSSISQWMDNYYLENAIKDLEASWEMSPIAFEDNNLISDSDKCCTTCGRGGEHQNNMNQQARLRGSVYVLLNLLQCTDHEVGLPSAKYQKLS